MASRGDGAVSVWDGQTGAVALELRGDTGGAVKAVAFAPDGDRLAITHGFPGRGPSLYDVGSWQLRPLDAAAASTRRVVFTADGELIAARYSRGPLRWSPSGAAIPLDGPEMIDLVTTPDRRRAMMLAVDGTVYALDGGGLRPVLRSPGASVVAAWAGGEAVATSRLGAIELEVPGRPHRRLELATRVLDLAVSPDERYLLAALIDGTVAIWRLDDLALVATLRGHTQRVAHLAVAGDGTVLGAGWDGQVLAWDLRALEATPAALIAELEARWGFELP